MSYSDALPIGVFDDFETDEEREEFLVNAFKSIAGWDFERRLSHDSDGFFAEPVGSAACLALGHVAYDDIEDDPLYTQADPVHEYGWDECLCLQTRYGSACTYCEGECCFSDTMPNLWELVAPKGGSAS